MPSFANIFKVVLRHKIISAVVLLVFIGGGYVWYASAHKNAGAVNYVTTPVQKGSIVVAVSGSGQVSASDQIDLKSKVSENVVYVGVTNGQEVKAGKLLMEFDTTTAQKKIRDAQLALDNANLSLEKTQSANATVPLTKQQAQDDLAKSYDDSFTTISNTFLDLPTVMTGLDDILFGNELNKNSENINYYRDYIKLYSDKADQYRDSAYNAYQKAKTDYDKNFNDYKSISRSADSATIEAMTSETYATTQDISDAIKSTNNLIQFYEDTLTTQNVQINPVAPTQVTSLNTYTGKVDGDLANLLSIQSTIKTDKDAITNADVNLQSQDVSVQQENLSVASAQNALADAKDNLADYYMYAPFDGIVANVALKSHDAASTGDTAVTFITNQSITEIPFNEVDITKIKIGQKATLTFDAIDGLTIVGKVADIDTLGTVTQGVVNYNVKIIFDARGSQVKPGMSVTANVVTNVKQDVLTVPNSAVKQSGGSSYVQVLVNGSPVRKTVQTGLSNDTDTEIISGLSEGENVITQTITASVAKPATSSTTSIRIPGLTGGGGFGGGRTGGN
jgi:HlyD family secretion protein